jgi:hypothetical protein
MTQKFLVSVSMSVMRRRGLSVLQANKPKNGSCGPEKGVSAQSDFGF